MDVKTTHPSCQYLLAKNDPFHGWLRRKTMMHKISNAMERKMNLQASSPLSNLFSWEKRYMVVHDGYLYIYKNETGRSPIKVLDLSCFDSVEEVRSLNAKDVPWPLKINSEMLNKTVLLGATSQLEQQKWIEALRRGIKEGEASGRRDKYIIKTQRPEEHSSEEDQDDYDYIEDVTRQDVKQPAESPRSVEYECHDISPPPHSVAGKYNREKLPVPEPPSQDRPIAAEKPRLERSVSGIALPARITGKPTMKVPPAIPQKKKPQNVTEPEEEETQYELEDEYIIVKSATWKGDSDEGLNIMKKMTENGVFMIRPSTTGNGDQTLQVFSDKAVRKYKITHEDGMYRMIGGGTFNSLFALIKHYQENSIPNHKTMLTKPYSKVLNP